MKNGSRASRPEDVTIYPPITRREALALFGGVALSVALAGCGGGNGDGSSLIAGDSNRTAISGDLTAQFNQFSAIADSTTTPWLGTSTALNTLRDQQGRATRAPADVKIAIQAITIG